MQESAQLQSVALFYFFTLLDDSLAKEASLATISKFQKKITRLRVPQEKIAPTIVNATCQGFQTFNKYKNKGYASISFEAGWLMPEGVDLGAWKDFNKSADENEFLAVVWSKILKFSDSEISQGLGVTEGTVRHRVSRGLRLLGQLRK